MEIERHIGICVEKLGQGRRQMLEAERHGRGDPDEAARGFRLIGGFRFGRFAFGQYACGAGERGLAGFGQRQPA
jgi:hypothetical protein